MNPQVPIVDPKDQPSVPSHEILGPKDPYHWPIIIPTYKQGSFVVIPSSKSLKLQFLQETRARPCASRPKLLRGPAPAKRSSSTSTTRQGGKLITRSSVKPSKKAMKVKQPKRSDVSVYINTGLELYRKTMYDYNVMYV